MKFGEFIKQQRDKKGWTQPEAAEKIQIEQSYLSKIENNKATPSSDIFDQLKLQYGFSIKELDGALSNSDLEKLTDIAVVKEFLLTMKKRMERHKRNWMIVGLLMTMWGAFSFALGIVMKDHTTLLHLYESKGVVKQGESLNIYNNLPSSSRLSGFISLGETQHFEQNPMFERLDYQQLTFDVDKGTFFTEDTQDGKRRFNRVQNFREQSLWPHYLGVSFGVMLLAGGLCSFYLRKKW